MHLYFDSVSDNCFEALELGMVILLKLKVHSLHKRFITNYPFMYEDHCDSEGFFTNGILNIDSDVKLICDTGQFLNIQMIHLNLITCNFKEIIIHIYKLFFI